MKPSERVYATYSGEMLMGFVQGYREAQATLSLDRAFGFTDVRKVLMRDAKSGPPTILPARARSQKGDERRYLLATKWANVLRGWRPDVLVPEVPTHLGYWVAALRLYRQGVTNANECSLLAFRCVYRRKGALVSLDMGATLRGYGMDVLSAFLKERALAEGLLSYVESDVAQVQLGLELLTL